LEEEEVTDDKNDTNAEAKPDQVNTEQDESIPANPSPDSPLEEID